MAYPGAEGGRRVYPEHLDETLAGVSRRRCVQCHADGVPQEGFVRVSEPELNDFLVAPLARDAGGRQTCGQAVFADRADPDHQALLAVFEPATSMLAARPREDMPGAVLEAANRSCE